MNHLLPCPSCARHFRANEPSCPFCGQTVSEAVRAAAAPVLPGRRLSRGALMNFRTPGLAAVAAVAIGCSGSNPAPAEPTPEPTGREEMEAPVYGGPPDPEPAPTTEPTPDPSQAVPEQPPQDPGLIRPLYGVPPGR